MKSKITVTLIKTIILLNLADSLIPTTNKVVIRTTMKTAGKLMNAPEACQPFTSKTNGLWHMEGGITIPKSAKKLVTYPAHPTATVADPKRYSRIKSQPMIQATNSPMVA